MAQRDYEEQPEAADLASSLHLETEETLSGPPGDGDALDAGYVPPDRPYVLDEDGVTGAGAREGETLDQKLARERPEYARDEDPTRTGRLAVAEANAVGQSANTNEAVDVGIDGGAGSAEEAAVHDVDAGFEPVADQTPLDDLEVTLSAEQDPQAERAERDAARDAAAGTHR